MPEDCIFCKIRDGEIPSEKLHSDVDCFVIRDINPAAPTHLLIIPTRHFATLSELADEHAGIYASMFVVARAMAEREGVADSGYRLIINQGSDGGQEVMHFAHASSRRTAIGSDGLKRSPLLGESSALHFLRQPQNGMASPHQRGGNFVLYASRTRQA
ncbi:Uncharacterized HIT-like protein aq_141 [Geodia barretti]|uniref:Uncharacterized HIT-like protein aq_141 n=1 Tax=Geodia barretti TaxID=519541 RepID=A0AA35XAA2_GEOBA|nr:Uncharacterized HIT-like protein aq_141 [Geodia barretti]